MSKLDPIERRRRLLSGEVDPAEAQRRKIEAHKRARAAGPSTAKRLDPIEAKRRALAKKAAEKRARTASWRVVMPKHLVVLVRPARPKATKPKPAVVEVKKRETKTTKHKRLELEDEITRRMADARRRLKGK